MKLRARYRLFSQMSELLHWQSLLIQAKDLEIKQLRANELLYQRHYLDLAIAFQQALDEDDPDISEKLGGIICDVSDLVARLEEHHV